MCVCVCVVVVVVVVVVVFVVTVSFVYVFAFASFLCVYFATLVHVKTSAVSKRVPILPQRPSRHT